MDILGIDIGSNPLPVVGIYYGKHGEHEGKALAALLLGGATQAPAITRNG